MLLFWFEFVYEKHLINEAIKFAGTFPSTSNCSKNDVVSDHYVGTGSNCNWRTTFFCVRPHAHLGANAYTPHILHQLGYI